MLASLIVASSLVVSIGQHGLQINDEKISATPQLSQVSGILGDAVRVDDPAQSAQKWDDHGIVASVPDAKSGAVTRLTLYPRDSTTQTRPQTGFKGTLTLNGVTLETMAKRWKVDKQLRELGFACHKEDENRHCVTRVGKIGGMPVAANLDQFGLISVQIGLADTELRQKLAIARMIAEEPQEKRTAFYHRQPCVALETIVVFEDELMVTNKEIMPCEPGMKESHHKRVEEMKASLQASGTGYGVVRTPARCN